MKKVIAGLTLFALNASAAFAQNAGNGGNAGNGSNAGNGQTTLLPNPLGSATFASIVSSILGALFTLSIPIVSIMIMVGGYYILTSGGDEEKLRKGRHAITYAVIGFVVILLANGIAVAVRQMLGL